MTTFIMVEVNHVCDIKILVYLDMFHDDNDVNNKDSCLRSNSEHLQLF